MLLNAVAGPAFAHGHHAHGADDGGLLRGSGRV